MRCSRAERIASKMMAMPDLSSPPRMVVPSEWMMDPSSTGLTPLPGTTVSMWAHNSRGGAPAIVPGRVATILPLLLLIPRPAWSCATEAPSSASCRLSTSATAASLPASLSIWTRPRKCSLMRVSLIMGLIPPRVTGLTTAHYRAAEEGGSGVFEVQPVTDCGAMKQNLRKGCPPGLPLAGSVGRALTVDLLLQLLRRGGVRSVSPRDQ